jgi:hypothetical protein
VVEEVTVLGQHTERPDVVLHINGIALVTLELKRSFVATSEGIRQTIGNVDEGEVRPEATGGLATGSGMPRHRLVSLCTMLRT